MIDDRTARLNLPLPNVGNLMKSQDVPRIIAAFQAIDAAIFAKATPADIATAVAAATVVTNTAIASAIAGLVNAAPGALDTLKELATALGNDASFATTVTNALALKANTSALKAVALSGAYSDLTGTPAAYSLPVSTTSAVGGVRVGANLSVDGSGLLAALSQIPSGIMAPFGGTVEPTGWLFCYGQAVSRTTYAALFAAIGIANGAGDASTTFNLPDLRGRVPVGRDNMGGTAASRMTSAGSGVDGNTLGAVGGAQTHTLTTAQIPAHNHLIRLDSTAGNSSTSASGAGTATPGPGYGGIATDTGGGGAHNNTQPSAIQNYIIKT